MTGARWSWVTLLCALVATACGRGQATLSERFTLVVPSEVTQAGLVPLGGQLPGSWEVTRLDLVDDALGPTVVLAEALVSGLEYKASWSVGEQDLGTWRLRARAALADGSVVYTAPSMVEVALPTEQALQSRLSAPTGLVAAAVDQAVSLRWEPMEAAIGFRLYRSTAAGFAVSAETQLASPMGPTWLDRSVSAGVPYFYRVTALSRHARSGRVLESAPSAEVMGGLLGSDLPPTVALTSPTPGTVVTSAQSVRWAAQASDDVGLSRVEFWDGAVLRGTDTSAPYEGTWSLGSADNGLHRLTAHAVDSSGHQTVSAPVEVTINVPVTDTLPPTVGEEQFSALIPAVEVRALEVHEGSRLLYRRSASEDFARPASVMLDELHGWLVVRWDAAAFPRMAVAHLGIERTTLALSLEGGEATLPLADVPPGGVFEVSLSDGIHGVRRVFHR